MVLLEDSRNQIGKHKNIADYCKKNGIIIRRSKLYVGDYQLPNDSHISVDTKQDVLEVASNVFQEHRRFREECVRAQEAGITLIVLVEEELPDGRLDHWVSPVWHTQTKYHKYGEPVSRVDPVRLRKAMYTMQDEYGVKFRFCSKRDAGQRLIEYLTGVRE